MWGYLEAFLWISRSNNPNSVEKRVFEIPVLLKVRFNALLGPHIYQNRTVEKFDGVPKSMVQIWEEFSGGTRERGQVT